ncbi:MAG: hypothetical protein WCT49_00710 [Candidatus Paceibacterota bacterium]|jgi:hypothetical protein
MNFLSSRIRRDSDSFSAAIATEQSEEIGTPEEEEIATIEVLAPCTRAIGPAQDAEPLSTNFLSNRMSPDSGSFSAEIATGQKEGICKTKKNDPARGRFFVLTFDRLNAYNALGMQTKERSISEICIVFTLKEVLKNDRRNKS